LGTRPEANNFPPRNRIISGLSKAVIIVEAGETSGALITADFAADQGRDVFVVPGDINRRSCRGSNRLIQQGAAPVLRVEDVLEGLNLEAQAPLETEKSLPADPVERSIYEVLSSDPTHIDDLGVDCGLSASELTAALSLMELRGQVRRVGGMHYVRTRAAD
jgi:DNA processing protein